MIIKLNDAKQPVSDPRHIYEMLKGFFKTVDAVDRDKEHFFVFHLDVRNKVKIMGLVSVGTLNMSLVHPREVFTRAIGRRTASIILAHNHPSEELEPSREDLIVTQRLLDAGRLLSIEVLDHVIYTSKGFHSFKEHGEL